MNDTADLLQQGIAASPRRGAVARQNPGIAREILERAHTVADQRVAGAGDDGEGVLEQRDLDDVVVVQRPRGCDDEIELAGAQAVQQQIVRSEERRVGKEFVSTFSTRWSASI